MLTCRSLADQLPAPQYVLPVQPGTVILTQESVPSTQPLSLVVSSDSSGPAFSKNAIDQSTQEQKLDDSIVVDRTESSILATIVDQNQAAITRAASLIVTQGAPCGFSQQNCWKNADFAVSSTAQNISRTITPKHFFRHPANRFFTGREEILQKITAALLDNSSESLDGSPKTFTIWGLPGQGKTQTALLFAMRQDSKFPSIHFVFAETEHKLLECFSGYAQSMGLVPEGSDNLKMDARELMRWYTTTGSRSLMLEQFVG